MPSISLPAIIATTAVAGAGVSAAGAIQAGQAKSNAASFQAQVAKNNEIIANQNADYALAAGDRQAAAVSLKGAATKAKIRTAQAANGVDINTGSAVNVQESEARTNELDTLTTANNAQLKAYGYRTQATNFQSEAELKEAEADQAKTGSYYSAAGGLLASASSLGGKWGGGSVPAATPAENYNSGNPIY